jgi:hypothetical protein
MKMVVVGAVGVGSEHHIEGLAVVQAAGELL